jgi:uncharacterized protein YcbX
VRGQLASLYRHPVKGFTPEPLTEALLTRGAGIAHDRLYAVEDGPSGFNPQAPAHISKQRFTVLAKIPELACVRTRYDDACSLLHAEAPKFSSFAGKLSEEEGRAAFAAWLTEALQGRISGVLRVIPGPGAHRFYDDPTGHVSLINLESVRDLGARLGRPIDPLRFRANLYVEGWAAWSELSAIGESVSLGAAKARITKAIRRCIATHVDPKSGIRDIDMLAGLQREMGHTFCGVYLHIDEPGLIGPGDAIERRP